MNEANIAINGTDLTEAQATVVRVAMTQLYNALAMTCWAARSPKHTANAAGK